MSRFIVCEHEQGTEGWFADRMGRVTGSKADCVFAEGKGNQEAFTRADYRMALVLENITRKPMEPDFKQTREMAWGNEQEPTARMRFEMEKGIDVGQSGFVYLKRTRAGCSVDGWLKDSGRQGILEIKCPKSKTHYAWLLDGRAPLEYMPQIIHNLWVTGAEFCDFMSFDPRMPRELQEFYVRVERDQKAIDKHEAGVLQFLAEVDRDEKRMRQLIEERKKPVIEEDVFV